MHTIPGLNTQIQVIATVIRDVLNSQDFHSTDALMDAVEARCAELKIPCRFANLKLALDLVGSNRRLVTATAPQSTRPAMATTPPIAHAVAKELLASIGVDVSSGRLTKSSNDNKGPDGFPRLVEVR